MNWAPSLDSRPLRPMPVLWLLPPWLALLAWTGGISVGAVREVPSPGGAGGDLARLVVFAWTVGAGALEAGLLALTWLWLALAVPVEGPRAGLWVAAGLLALPWTLGRGGGDVPLWLTAPSFAAAAACAAYSVVVTRVRGAAVWARASEADV